MPSVHNSFSDYSPGSSSFDTFERNRELPQSTSDSTSLAVSVASSDSGSSSLQDEESDNDYDAVEVRRRQAADNENNTPSRSFFVSTPQDRSPFDRILDFFQIDDDSSLHSTSLSQSPSEYVKPRKPDTKQVADNKKYSGETKHHRIEDPRVIVETLDTRDAPSTRDASRSVTQSTNPKMNGELRSILLPPRIAKHDNDAPRDGNDTEADDWRVRLDNSLDSVDSPVGWPPSWRKSTWPRYGGSVHTNNDTGNPDFNSWPIADHTTPSPGKRKLQFFPADTLEEDVTGKSSTQTAYNFQPIHQVAEDIYASIEDSPAPIKIPVSTGSNTLEDRASTRSSTMSFGDLSEGARRFHPSIVREASASVAQVESRSNTPDNISQNKGFYQDMSVPPIEIDEDLLAQFRKKPKRAFKLEKSIQGTDIRDQKCPSLMRDVDGPNVSQTDLSLELSYDTSLNTARANNITLHDLCTDAKSRGDPKWGDAVTLLSLHPHFAKLLDNGWTPLHISCLGSFAPPDFFVRALLVAAPEATQVLDNGGRLPLHLLAATSAEPDVMQMLVDEYACAITSYDDKGMLPLHLLLQNDSIHLTLHHVRILLGQTIKTAVEGQYTRVSKRRGDHLHLSFQEVNEIVYRDERLNERVRNNYPEEIQEALRRLSRWKAKQSDDGEGVGTTRDGKGRFSSLNPAALSASSSGRLALHMAASRNYSTLDSNDNVESSQNQGKGRLALSGRTEIVRVLIAANPAALTAKDSDGRTPLLVAICCKDSLPDLDMIELLLGRNVAGFESPPVWAENMEVHKAQGSRFSNPAMMITKDTHQTPLHIAAEQMTTNVAVLTAIYEAYPGAVHVQDVRGRTPLHLGLDNFQGLALDPKAFALLLTNRVAQTKDDDGMLPFDHFVQNLNRLPQFHPDTHADDNSTADVYKQFFQDSFVPAAFPKGDSASFLKRLRKFPRWLRRYALSAGFVKDKIHELTIQAPHVAVILLHGVLLGAFLTLFRIQMDRFSKAQEIPIYSAGIYPLAFFIILYQLLYCSVLSKASLFVPECLFTVIFWVDVAGVSLAVVATTFMYSDNVDIVAILGTTATGLLWMSIIGYIARWWYGMAVFVGGVASLGKMLFWPLIAGTILVVAFAQTLWSLNLTNSVDECESTVGGRGLCNVHDAYMTVYLLLLGTPLLDTSDDGDDLTIGTIILIATFTVIFVLFLFNLIISVVQKASSKDWNGVATTDFWESKLMLVYLVADVRAGFSSWFSVFADGSRTCSMTCNRNLADTLARLWDACILSFFSRSGTGSFGRCSRIPWLSGPFLFLSRSATLFLIPIWIIVGGITMGLLWPPQVRSWLFRIPKLNRDESSFSSSGTARNVACLRDELLQLKIMSFEKANSIEQHVWELRQIMLGAVKDERCYS